MTLVFLRRDCADLYDFRSERLGEPDWLAAAHPCSVPVTGG